ncbi:MAG TPA: HepT-like ribonuclease domain-containing protein [Vicinamibacterales bacterium]|nr:HepT-like ribonuclease domain-containing protein [Vicinamibacterales bacterium]
MTLDADVVRARCQEIEQSLARLERIRRAGRDAFLADTDTQDIGCYRLLVAIEAALALCYHVSARHLRIVPGLRGLLRGT